MIHLSIIIPTRNRSGLLLQTLHSIQKQSFPKEKWEVIVVDNGSTDDTKVICEGVSATINNFTYIYDATPGLHVGRHVGLKAAKGDILVYADDDIKAFPQWLEGINESFEDPQVAMVGGKNIPLYEISPPAWEKRLWQEIEFGRYNPFYSVLDFGDTKMEISPFFIWGCNFSIRKEVLKRIGGFHPDGMPKDSMRFRGDGETAVSASIIEMNLKAIYDPKASVEHWVPKARLTIDYVYQRSFNQGISDSFTEIRASHLNGIEAGKKVLLSSSLRKVKKELINLKKIYKEKLFYKDPVDFYRIKGHKDGYNFHQKEIKRDSELLKWVLKPNYID